MKHFFLFLFVFSIIGLSYASGDNRIEFSVKEAVKIAPDPEQAEVTVQIKNLTNGTLFFLTSTCSNSHLYSIEGPTADLMITACYVSFPDFLRIAPCGYYLDTLSVESARMHEKSQPFRISIKLIETKEKIDAAKAFTEPEKQINTFWTDYIQIK